MRISNVRKPELARFIGIKNPPPLFGDTAKPTAALSQGKQIVEHLLNSGQKNVQVVPVTILWGRDPGKEKPGIRTLITHSLTPSWFRKFLLCCFLGAITLFALANHSIYHLS